MEWNPQAFEIGDLVLESGEVIEDCRVSACILGMDQHIALAHVAEARIGSGDQIARGIGQGAVEIENHCLHWILLGRNPALQNGIVLQSAI